VPQVRARLRGANLGSVAFESTAQTAGGPHNAVFVVWGFYQCLLKAGCPMLARFFRKGGFHELVDRGKSGAPRLLIRYNVESLDRRPKCLVQASKRSL
jgi:hypothetical protein